MTRGLVVAVLLALHLQGAERRALLVGIDHYSKKANGIQSKRTRLRLSVLHGTPARRSLQDLGGAVNDAEAMKEMLVDRFDFKEKNIVLLTNEQATADRILEQLQSHLVDKSQPGDSSLFYFAGHGSRVRNTAEHNKNSSGFDSTLVPADALLGVPDIRSKELARIYDHAVKKGVTLTVIHDSCYSGAATRGPISVRQVRSQPSDEGVSVNEVLDVPLPEDEGVLVLSASQDFEPAAELESTDLGGAHGAFTWALLNALGTSPVDSAADRIFQRLRALMQSKVPDQEPVLLAKKGRNELGLFGQPAVTGRSLTVAAARVTDGVIKLNAGLAANLAEGCELRRADAGKSAVEIQITKVRGLSSSDAVIVRKTGGDATVRPGDLFELTKWVAPDRELMRVYIPPAAPEPEFRRLIEAAGKFRGFLVSDPTEETPTHVLTWSGEDAQWALTENRSGAAPVLIRTASADAIVRLLPKKARLFVQFPPDSSIAGALKFEDGAVMPADSPGRSDYVLVGRLEAGSDHVSYAWALAEIAVHSSRPLRSDWYPASEAPGALRKSALSLARVTGWLNLAFAAGEGAGPFQLVLRNTKTKEMISSGTLRLGESYKLFLRPRTDSWLMPEPSRRVYVVVVDSHGEAKLVFGDNLGNEFPRPGQELMADPTPLTNDEEDLIIGDPPGIDHYFLLTSVTPIDSPETVFNFEGVRSRGSIHNPLTLLLGNMASGKRGGVSNIPTDWSIDCLTLVSVKQ